MVRISLVTLLTFFLSVCFFVTYAHTETHANTHTQVRILLHIALIYQETSGNTASLQVPVNISLS